MTIAMAAAVARTYCSVAMETTTLPAMTRPTLAQYTSDENERLRSFLRAEFKRRDWSGRHAALAMGVAPQTVNLFLSGKNGAGRHLVEAVEKTFGCSIDDILGRAGPRTAIRFREQPGWYTAVAQAKQLFKDQLPDAAYEEIGGWSSDRPPTPDPRVIFLIASAWFQNRPVANDAALGGPRDDDRDAQ